MLTSYQELVGEHEELATAYRRLEADMGTIMRALTEQQPGSGSARSPAAAAAAAGSIGAADVEDATMHHLKLVGPDWTPTASPQPAILPAETEAEFAGALDQALATGLPVEAPVEILRAFGVPECDEESAEAADWSGRPDLALLQGGVDEL